MPRKRIVCVYGTRPEAVKMAPIIQRLRKENWVELRTLFTGQHRELASEVMADFGIDADTSLNVMAPDQTLTGLTAKLLQALEPQLQHEKPDMMIAQGDTTTVMTVALACFYQKIPFAHIEAGLRTGDMQNPFPEEFNRVVCGRLASLHFAPTRSAAEALLKEQVPKEQIMVVGNTVIDALFGLPETALEAPWQIRENRRLILMTVHRRENFGEPLARILSAVRDIVDNHDDVEVLLPVHPNPNVERTVRDMLGSRERIHLCSPLPYRQFTAALRQAYLVITDSGGVQEEAPALGKPVVVTREQTERPEAVEAGVAILAGTQYKRIYDVLNMLLTDQKAYRRMALGGSPYGDGKAAERIVDALRHYFDISARRETEDFVEL